jgi:cobalt-zinc-cadmium efflux system protein
MACAHSFDIGKRFKTAILLSLAIFILEIAGGLWAHSLALLSDAAHVFMDVSSLTLSWIALRLAERPATDTRTFGLHRAETFAAFINGLTLTLISVWVIYEALQRFSHPQEVHSQGMLLVASVGFFVNLAVAFTLKGHNAEDLNVRSAYLHVLGDLMASVGVVAGAIVIGFTGWNMVDPILSFGIGIVILFGSFGILRKSSHIFLEGVPESITYGDVDSAFRGIDGVEDVHELHIWSLCSHVHSLSAHVVVNDRKVSLLPEIMDKINTALLEKFNISHTTLQFECKENCQGQRVCSIRH